MKRRKGTLRRRYGRALPWNDKSVQYEAPLGAPHEEVRVHADKTATLFRFGRPVVIFKPSPAQMKKIRAGSGTLRITTRDIARAR